MKNYLFYAFFIILFCVQYSIGQQNFKQLFDKKGKLNSKYEFIHGQYFLKEGAKQEAFSVMSVSAQYYSQCLDHFSNPPCNSSWEQRFWQNDNYYKTNGPIFFYLGAEGLMDGCADDFFWQYLWYGVSLGAKFVCMEHRFYGQSYPTNDQSASSLKVLTSQQALADYVEFIRWFKTREGLSGAKVIVFGGSYGGNLAAWIKQVYPNDINVAVSSSGPLNATFNMTQYMQTVSEVIYYTNASCYYALYNIFKCMQNIVNGNNGCSPFVKSSKELPKAVNYCYPVNFTKTQERERFYATLAYNVWASNYPASQNGPLCQSLLTRYYESSTDPVAAYGKFLKDKNKSWGCKSNAKKRSVGTLSLATDSKSWLWQTCNEFGLYQPSDPTYGLFGANTWSANYHASICRYYWSSSGFTNEKIQANVAKTNDHYKGLNYYGNCSIFVNGGYDPWYKLGISSQSQTTTDNSVVFIPTGEHCSDMGHTGVNADVKAGQDKIQTLIQQYLKNANC